MSAAAVSRSASAKTTTGACQPGAGSHRREEGEEEGREEVEEGVAEHSTDLWSIAHLAAELEVNSLEERRLRNLSWTCRGRVVARGAPALERRRHRARRNLTPRAY